MLSSAYLVSASFMSALVAHNRYHGFIKRHSMFAVGISLAVLLHALVVHMRSPHPVGHAVPVTVNVSDDVAIESPLPSITTASVVDLWRWDTEAPVGI